MFEYTAVLDRVVDGDTIDVTIDLGFKTFKKTRVRLARINAPESRTRDIEEKERGIKAKEALEDMLEPSCGTTLVLRTFKDKGKYGRFVADVLIRRFNLITVDGVIPVSDWSVNDMLVDTGHAVYKDY